MRKRGPCVDIRGHEGSVVPNSDIDLSSNPIDAHGETDEPAKNVSHPTRYVRCGRGDFSPDLRGEEEGKRLPIT